MSDRLRHLCVAFSLANLLLLAVWSELLFTNADSQYYMLAPPSSSDYLAAVADTILLALLFFIAVQLIHRTRINGLMTVAKITFLGAVIIAANTIRFKFTGNFGIGVLYARFHQNRMLTAAVLISACLGIIVFRFRRQLFQALVLLLFILMPFALITTGQALLKAIFIKQAVPNSGTSSSDGTVKSGPRVVWIIFDELDESMLFTRRPPGLNLRAWDSFQKSAIQVAHAESPSRGTMISIPSLLTGRPLLSSRPQGSSELLVTTQGASEPVALSSIRNIFIRAREVGMHTSAVGWYHPYCRLFQNSLNRCSWQPVFQTITGQVSTENKTICGAMLDQLAAIFPFNHRRLAIHAYRKILEDAKDAVAHESGLIFIHFPVPHEPAIYDRKNGHLTTTAFSNINGYVDNLALTDRTLGELQKVMEDNGTWEHTAIIVSSDHPWRHAAVYDGRQSSFVPFLIKMPGQSTAVDLKVNFPTVNTADLVMSILTGQVIGVQGAIQWIEAHARPWKG